MFAISLDLSTLVDAAPFIFPAILAAATAWRYWRTWANRSRRSTKGPAAPYSFQLDGRPVDGSPRVYVNRSQQIPGVDYTIAADVLTFTDPIARRDTIEIEYTPAAEQLAAANQ
jgi:hypothetical protein